MLQEKQALLSREDAPTGESSGAPSLWARLLAERFWLTMAMFVAVSLPSWWIYVDVRDRRAIPLGLWASAGLAFGLLLAVLLSKLLSREVRRAARYNETRRDSDELLREAKDSLKAHAFRLTPTQSEELSRAAGELEEARTRGDWERAGSAVTALDDRLHDYLGDVRKSTAREYLESIVIAVAIALFLRAFVVEAFKIPSGSMIPTLQVGDHIFVNKFIYGIRIPWTDIKLGMGIRKPERGEVVVFKYPKDPDKDFIKRIVGIEGDTIEIKQGVLYVNGQAAPRERADDEPCAYDDFDEIMQRWEHRRCEAWIETLGGHRYKTLFERGGSPRTWQQSWHVPPGSVFVMGDNRDNSHDSRYWGFVKFEQLRGRAMVIFLSRGRDMYRVERIGKAIE